MAELDHRGLIWFMEKMFKICTGPLNYSGQRCNEFMTTLTRSTELLVIARQPHVSPYRLIAFMMCCKSVGVHDAAASSLLQTYSLVEK